MKVPHPVLNESLTWHDRKMWNEALSLLATFFRQRKDDLSGVQRMASLLRAEIDAVDGFIQLNTSQVCPDCRKVCCINKHSYHDYHDLIYITLLGMTPPPYREDVDDADPCQFLSEYGCTIDRPIRPFRCNWHFCSELIAFMNSGPAKPMREFNLHFKELQALRQEMIENFFGLL